MKVILTTGLLLVSLCVLSAQESSSVEERFLPGNDSLETSRLETPASRLDFGMEMGTGISVSPGIGSYSWLYAAPDVSIPLNQRLSVHGGMLLSSAYPALVTRDQNLTGVHSYTSLALFTAASYRVDENFTLYGAGMKSVLSFDSGGELLDTGSSAFSFGASYRIGKNVTIGASVVVSDGNRYYPFSPASNFYHPTW